MNKTENYQPTILVPVCCEKGKTAGLKKIANNFCRPMAHDSIKDTGCPLATIHTALYPENLHHQWNVPILPASVRGKVKQVPARHSHEWPEDQETIRQIAASVPFQDYFACQWMRKRYINNSITETNI